jgi:hypothetical protein
MKQNNIRKGTYGETESRRAAFLSSHGYDEVQSEPVQSYVSHLLDHGFVAKSLSTGRLVVFGDPYTAAIKLADIEEIERQGFEVRAHAGVWDPERTTLLEFLVKDPDRARDFIREGRLFVARQPGRFAPMSEAKRYGAVVARWIPAGAHTVKAKAKRVRA